MATPFARACSRFVGWLVDRRLPRPLRAPVYRAYARATGADLSQLRLALEEHPSLGAFFIRRLKDGARSFPSDASILPSPVDGTVQSFGPIERGSVLQAKGRPYEVQELLGSSGLAAEVHGGHAWTIYLSPRDYHRIHSPVDGALSSLSWLPGSLYSVAPKVLLRRPKVLSVNERVVMRIATDRGPFFLVAVGALNVGRIRVVGVEPHAPAPDPPLRFGRGDELARFEMGSTVVLLCPSGSYAPLAGLTVGSPLKMGEPIGSCPA